MTSVLDKINAGAYKVKYDDSIIPKDREARNAFYKAIRAAESALQDQFVVDLEDEFGLTGHPKAKNLYGLAYERGHSSGMSDVYSAYSEMAELITNGMNADERTMSARLDAIIKLLDASNGGRGPKLPLMKQLRDIATGEVEV